MLRLEYDCSLLLDALLLCREDRQEECGVPKGTPQKRLCFDKVNTRIYKQQKHNIMNIKSVHETIDALQMKSVDSHLIVLASSKTMAACVEGEDDLNSAALAYSMENDDRIRDIVIKAYQIYCYDMSEQEEGGEE